MFDFVCIHLNFCEHEKLLINVHKIWGTKFWFYSPPLLRPTPHYIDCIVAPAVKATSDLFHDNVRNEQILLFSFIDQSPRLTRKWTLFMALCSPINMNYYIFNQRVRTSSVTSKGRCYDSWSVHGMLLVSKKIADTGLAKESCDGQIKIGLIKNDEVCGQNALQPYKLRACIKTNTLQRLKWFCHQIKYVV